MDDNEWHEWRGSIDMRIKVQDKSIEDIENRLNRLEEKVADLIAKISLPLFAMQIAGTAVGAIVVWLLTKGTK